MAILEVAEKLQDFQAELHGFEKSLPDADFLCEPSGPVLAMKHLIKEANGARGKEREKLILTKTENLREESRFSIRDAFSWYYGWCFPEYDDSRPLPALFLHLISVGVIVIPVFLLLRHFGLDPNYENWVLAGIAICSSLFLAAGVPLLAFFPLKLKRAKDTEKKISATKQEMNLDFECQDQATFERPALFLKEIARILRGKIDVFHSRFGQIKTDYEKTVVIPRKEAVALKYELEKRRNSVECMEIPDKSEVLRQVEGWIKDCETITATIHPDEGVIFRYIVEITGSLNRLYDKPIELERLALLYKKQDDVLDDLRLLGKEVQGLSTQRGEFLEKLLGQFKELKSEIGLIAKTTDDFMQSLQAVKVPELLESQ